MYVVVVISDVVDIVGKEVKGKESNGRRGHEERNGEAFMMQPRCV